MKRTTIKSVFSSKRHFLSPPHAHGRRAERQAKTNGRCEECVFLYGHKGVVTVRITTFCVCREKGQGIKRHCFTRKIVNRRNRYFGMTLPYVILTFLVYPEKKTGPNLNNLMLFPTLDFNSLRQGT